ncbi:hypothetical protein [Caenispirillum salinarum]|uniref:hypothetical protein n=1 Tax=Caenispirillum salinarum TaxID=859058 RepID=UPI00384C2E98
MHTDRIRAALAGRLSPDDLTQDEFAIWLEAFGAKMSNPTLEAEAFFAERRRRGLGVGITKDGRLVHAKELLWDDVFDTPGTDCPRRLEPAGSDRPGTPDD